MKKRVHKTKLIKVSVLESCGCCTSILQFESEERALDALKKSGLGVSQTITDDTGKVFDSLDTFYGMTLVKEQKFRKNKQGKSNE